MALTRWCEKIFLKMTHNYI